MIPSYQPPSLQPSPVQSSPLGPNSNLRPRVIPPSARKHFKDSLDTKNRAIRPTNV